MQNADNRTRLAQCVAMIIAGVLFFLVGSMILGSSGSRIKCTERVTATVKKNLEVKKVADGVARGSNTTKYMPVFEYEFGGKKYSAISKLASRPAEFAEGEIVTIRVNPKDPEEIYYTPRGGALVMSILFEIAGGALAVGGIIALKVIKTKTKPPKQTLN